MNFKDITPELTSVASTYGSVKTPEWLNGVASFLSTLISYLSDLWNQLRFTVGSWREPGSMAQILQFFILLVGTVLLAFVVVVSLKKMRYTKYAQMSAKLIPVEQALSAKAWRARADELASSKEFEQAIRALYFSALYLFDEHGIAKIAFEKTNREYVVRLETQPDLKALFVQLADIQEEVIYGGKKADAAVFGSSKDWLEQITIAVDKAEIESRQGQGGGNGGF